MSIISNAIKAYFASQLTAGATVRWSALSFAVGADITIAAGTSILMDKAMLDSEYVGNITNNGTLLFDTNGPRLLCYSLTTKPGGKTLVGTAAAPYAAENGRLHFCSPAPTVSGNPGGGPIIRGLTHDLTTDVSTGNNGGLNDNGGLARGFINDGGTVEMYCARAPIQARLAAAVVAGATTITIDRLVTMPAGSTVLVCPDGFYNAATRTESRTLAVAAVNTNVLSLNASLGFARFGRNQYMTDNGCSLTQDSFTNGRTSTYTGSISGATLTITAATGTISVGQKVMGAGVLLTSYVIAFGTGTGGVGTYTLSQAMTVASTALQLVGMKTDAAMTPLLETAAFVAIYAPQFTIDAFDLPGQTHIATLGFGWHGMTMQLTSKTVIKNVGMNNFGQLGMLGRYAWHFHNISYNADGTSKTTGAGGTNKFIAGNAVIDGCAGGAGHNRFGVLHAVVGAVIQNCIAYQAKGHAFFEEDGSEQECTLSGNLAIGFDDPGTGLRLKAHDRAPIVDLGVTANTLVGFWISNPFNTHTNNWAVDSPGGPWWNSHSFGLQATQIDFQHGCLGASANVPISAGFGKMGVWDGNSGMSCDGLHGSNNGATHNSGRNANTGNKLKITTDGLTIVDPSATPLNEVANGMLLSNVRVFKCVQYSNVVSQPNYQFWKSVDLKVISFSGITNFGSATFPILIRQSLNHESNFLANIRSMGFAAYHGTMKFIGICADGFTGTAYTTNGGNGGAVENIAVQETWEEYTVPVQDFHIANSGWAMRNSRGLWQTPPAHLTEAVTTYDYITGTVAGGPKFTTPSTGTPRRFTLGVMYDRFGTLSTGPTQAGQPNSHVVWNQPYFTTGLTVTALEGNPESCWTNTPFLGLTLAQGGADDPRRLARNKFQRCNSLGVDIVGAVWDMPDFAGVQLLSYHHGAFPIGGFVKWTWPDIAAPTTVLLGNDFTAGTGGIWSFANPNLNTATDVAYIGIQWAGATAVFRDNSDSRLYDSVGITSLATLIASTTGNKTWLDTTNQLCWIKKRPGASNFQWSLRLT